jgi:hypothetical protein
MRSAFVSQSKMDASAAGHVVVGDDVDISAAAACALGPECAEQDPCTSMT